MVLAENIFGNLLSLSNVAEHVVIPAEAGLPELPGRRLGTDGQGIQSASSVLLLAIPTAIFPNAAIIQLWVDRANKVDRDLQARSDGGALSRETLDKRAYHADGVVGDRSENEPGEIIVYEGLLYISEDGDELDAASSGEFSWRGDILPVDIPNPPVLTTNPNQSIAIGFVDEFKVFIEWKFQYCK